MANRTSDLDRFFALKERGPHRDAPAFDPDDSRWLPVHSMVQALELRVAELEERVAS